MLFLNFPVFSILLYGKQPAQKEIKRDRQLIAFFAYLSARSTFLPKKNSKVRDMANSFDVCNFVIKYKFSIK